MQSIFCLAFPPSPVQALTPIHVSGLLHKHILLSPPLNNRGNQQQSFWTMDILVKQKRVRISSPETEKQEEIHGTRERSFDEDNRTQGWFKSHFSGHVNEDYDSRDIEFAAAVGAAAVAIHSLEEAELAVQMKMREDLEPSRTKLTIGQPSSGRPTRSFSSMQNAEKLLINNSMEQKEALERAFPTRLPSHTSSLRPTSSADGYQLQSESSSRQYFVGTKADTWERAKMEKIRKRYEKKNSRILAWENKKKMQAQLKMEKRRGESEQKRASNLHHYQSKIERINQIAGVARGEVEEKRRNEEKGVREKAEKIRLTGRVPIRCLCFYCH
ncbi:uncharacterized protein LOC121234237 [Juglans microcarpa x Juglans regia]|uniref:uncharacterized protein LOC121234237 n=1 Tax=Juglans microcarpa x Juglans regia TaxID=2249226 RepID=UPI001B7E0CD4|nr:uncharacterized protein LOC121234237 [Juglans microcarpa x Juglans regia]